jgi:hypothetical protein
VNALGARFAVLALSAALVAGCGYSTESLHRTDVRTVAVPIFASHEFRRELEFELSKELVKMIEMRTPYKVVQDRTRADTELRGEILDLRSPVLAEDVSSDSPIDVEVTVLCWFEWKDLRTGEMLAQRPNLQASASYAVAIGETLDSATTEALRRLAERIVEAMEKDW